MQRIRLAVKCDQSPNALDRFMRIADRFGITALEIQETVGLMQALPLEMRVENVAAAAKGKICRLCYHVPAWGAFRTWKEAEKWTCYDLASDRSGFAMLLAKETLAEAVEAGLRLGLNEPVLANFHIWGLAPPASVCRELKFGPLERGERALSELKRFADDLCRQRGFVRGGRPMVHVVRENNPIYFFEEVFGMVDAHPCEFARRADFGVNVDFAHLQLAINYLKTEKSSRRAQLEAELYPELTWRSVAEIAGGTLELLHLNDASGYTLDKEGITIGTGEIRFEECVPLICGAARRELVGTVEIKDQHLKPERFVNSVLALKKRFGKEYDVYFF